MFTISVLGVKELGMHWKDVRNPHPLEIVRVIFTHDNAAVIMRKRNMSVTK
jgi:hypothetical protein